MTATDVVEAPATGAATRLRALVRAPLWFTAKLLPLVAAAELAALTAGVPGTDGVARTVAMLCSAVSVAAGAHLVNDLADRASDRAAGKANVLDQAHRRTPLVLLGLCAVGAVLPWWIVPIDPWAALVLIGLVGLSIAYSVPPVRLKGRAAAGIVADAFVAHVLPVTLAFPELGGAGQRTATWWWAAVAAACWAFGFGVRNIVVHEVLDADGDRAAGIRTYVVARGVPRAVRTGRDAFALELLGLLALLAVTAVTAWGVALFFALHWLLWLHHRRFERPPIDTVPTTADAWLPVAEFYEVWPALAFGVALGLRDPVWWWLVGAVVVVFWPAVRKQAVDELGLVVELLRDVAERYVRDVLWAGVRAAWWATYRGYWRLRHAVVDPAIAWERRQRGRLRRHLGRPPSTGGPPPTA